MGIMAEDVEKVELVIEGGPQMVEKGKEKEPVEMVDAPTKSVKRYSKKIITGVINLGPASLIQIGDTTIGKRLPPPPVFDIKASSYYMNNREIFVNFIDTLFEPYKEDLMDETQNISCDNIGKDTGKVGLLTHQKIVRDYINLYTPYRGLLLFHGLGSGKTCSSIAIAEGLKSYRQIIVMTPASLRRNYIEEIKKCGDLLFRKNQFWEWVSVEGRQELIEPLAEVMGGIKINYDNEQHSNWVDYIKRHKGVWLVNVTKPTNYEELSTSDKKNLNDQIDEMIQLKYTFINYNGLREKKFGQMTMDYKINNIKSNEEYKKLFNDYLGPNNLIKIISTNKYPFDDYNKLKYYNTKQIIEYTTQKVVDINNNISNNMKEAKEEIMKMSEPPISNNENNEE
jgi:hypothetical protein